MIDYTKCYCCTKKFRRGWERPVLESKGKLVYVCKACIRKLNVYVKETEDLKAITISEA
jgi:hypothetical protein